MSSCFSDAWVFFDNFCECDLGVHARITLKANERLISFPTFQLALVSVLLFPPFRLLKDASQALIANCVPLKVTFFVSVCPKFYFLQDLSFTITFFFD